MPGYNSAVTLLTAAVAALAGSRHFATQGATLAVYPMRFSLAWQIAEKEIVDVHLELLSRLNIDLQQMLQVIQTIPVAAVRCAPMASSSHTHLPTRCSHSLACRIAHRHPVALPQMNNCRCV